MASKINLGMKGFNVAKIFGYEVVTIIKTMHSEAVIAFNIINRLKFQLPFQLANANNNANIPGYDAKSITLVAGTPESITNPSNKIYILASTIMLFVIIIDAISENAKTTLNPAEDLCIKLLPKLA